VLGKVDLGLSIPEKEYGHRIAEQQVRLRACQEAMFRRGGPAALVVFEGWDAAGKGGAIKRLTEALDPRGFEVTSFSAPHGDERSRHYLWRFWRRVPPRGRIAVFDRSHYGRVLVERVEGFCTPAEGRRAYREINEWEGQLAASGCVLVKFWIHIGRDEQLRRFRARERDPFRRYKLTEEDWRNRARWDEYEEAVERMLRRTHTPDAPWTVVEGNDKRWARVKVVGTVADRLEAALGKG
jgi:polyphosphate kinase 2 (PPK2 family)